ncbi:MAG TPA: hypothetical protein VFT05_09245 [Burkholderiaceae bacterium]|nr:hypothetical protein [Burkholderiaceae bacterium]
MNKAGYLLALVIAAGAASSPMVLAQSRPALAAFAQMDQNRDGKVSAAEHAAGARAMFVRMDANHDGIVTAAEMEAAQPAVTGKASSAMPAAAKIKVADGDGDGKLTAAEHDAASQSMFLRMDTNHDGMLTEAEMAAGHAAMLGQH